MSDFLVLATGGAGGDLPPLMASMLGLRDRGHRTILVGDASVAGVAGEVDADVDVLAPALDLGPRLIAAIRDAMREVGDDPSAAGPIVRDRMSAWAQDVAAAVETIARRERPEAIVTSLFGVEVLAALAPSVPWAVINSTFAVGCEDGRPLQDDVAPRALPLMAHLASLLDAATLVLHATDRVFDFGGCRLPPHHQYVGPLGIWEPPTDPLDGLDDAGDPWILATISSQHQDDIALAEAVLSAVDRRPLRVLLTLGPGHGASELSFVPVNARIEGVVSHAEVLRRASLLISHAGHGSVMKALFHGTPMVLVPWGRDQPGVAARAEALGVAVVVRRESVSATELRVAIDAALADATMRQRAEEHAARLRATDPVLTSVELLERML
jgi:EryCIII-like glycosyltransferase